MARRRFQEIARKYALDPEVVDALKEAFQDDLELPEPVTASHTVAPLTGMTWIPDLDLEEVDTTEIVLGDAFEQANRFEDLGPIGIGGMGEVRRVRDPILDRVVAMKVLRAKHLASQAHASRFVAEARTTAQLEHPGIVPVHELGRLPDGRVFFTMKEVRGRTLSAVLRDVHVSSGADAWRNTADGWNLRRLIDALYRVAEAVAYAHSRGVIHRDIKPANVMVGTFGEVMVMDWGLAKLVGADSLDEPTFGGLSGSAASTVDGAVSGTPAYMAPEQARGESESLGPEADVYALGATLYEVLTGRPPYRGRSGQSVLNKVLAGPPPPPAPLGSHPGPPIPEELARICEKAMCRDQVQRYRHAGEFAAALSEWLVGARREEQAAGLLARAEAMDLEVAELRTRAAALTRQAEDLRAKVPAHGSVEVKRGLWSLEDEAEAALQQARLTELEANEVARSVLSLVPRHPSAQARLADYYHRRHQEAEAARDPHSAAAYEVLLRAHGARRYAGYLKGTGLLNIITDPPGATVEVYAMVERDRRLFPENARRLGKTPLMAVELPVGRYLLLLKSQGTAPVRLPVRIDRNGYESFIPPGGSEPYSIPLYPRRAFGPDECYVPAGWAEIGGDPALDTQLPAGRVWVDGFAIQRHPVTFGDLLTWFDDLRARGRLDEIARHLPRERGETATPEGSTIVRLDQHGRYAMFPDHEGDLYHEEWPAMLVDWDTASAYAGWLAERTGKPWRLPSEVEWEKAARGTDGRFFPWGDRFDPSFCAMYESAPRATPVVIGDYPFDESPYGVRGLAGSCRDWCGDAWSAEPEIADGRLVQVEATSGHPVRGGAWNYGANRVRVAYRNYHLGHHRYNNLGFRLARSLRR